MINVTYILSNIDKAVAFEWIVKSLDKDHFQLSFILLNSNNSYLESFLNDHNIENVRLKLDGKKDYFRCILQTRKHLKRLNSDVVHCHMRDANFIGLIAAKLASVRQRIFTRHYSTYNHKFHPNSVKFDRMINKLATDVVAISKVVYNTLVEKENVPATKVRIIYHGFDLVAFNQVESKIVEALKDKYNLSDNEPIIGVISRYIEWKGHKFIIPAFKKLKDKYPKAKFVFANANGPQATEIKKMINEQLDSSAIEIKFEKDIFTLYHLFDIYVHTPNNKEIEAFGQTYVEALASGIPSVFTISGIANEFVQNRENALVVSHQNSNEIYSAIEEILANPSLQQQLIEGGKKSIAPFALDLFIKKLEDLYSRD